AGPNGPEQLQRLRRQYFIECATRTKSQKAKKPKNYSRPEAAKTLSGCCGFSRLIRSSPKFAKANSIVWMIPNEWPGAWMPLALGCRGGAPHQAASGGLSSGCKPQKAATQWQLNQPSGLAY